MKESHYSKEMLLNSESTPTREFLWENSLHFQLSFFLSISTLLLFIFFFSSLQRHILAGSFHVQLCRYISCFVQVHQNKQTWVTIHKALSVAWSSVSLNHHSPIRKLIFYFAKLPLNMTHYEHGALKTLCSINSTKYRHLISSVSY